MRHAQNFSCIDMEVRHYHASGHEKDLYGRSLPKMNAHTRVPISSIDSLPLEDRIWYFEIMQKYCLFISKYADMCTAEFRFGQVLH